MPVPKYKRTVYRSKQQTAAWREKIMKRLTNYLQFTPCSNCGTTKLAHTVCQACAGGAKTAKITKRSAKKGGAATAGTATAEAPVDTKTVTEVAPDVKPEAKPEGGK